MTATYEPGTKAELITQCAWCGAVEVAGTFHGAGLPLFATMTERTGAAHGVTHGICPDCFEGVKSKWTSERR